MTLIKSFSVGNGDMFYIDHGTDNFTTIDCCYDDDNEKEIIFNEIKTLSSKKGVTRFISTHPDDDHIKGLKEFDKVIGINNFYCVENEATKEEETEDFNKYCDLRDGKKHYYISKGCSRKWMNKKDEGRGSSGISCLWPITSNMDYKLALQDAKNGKCPNNISPIIIYSLENGVKAMWMGDLENDFIEKIQSSIDIPKVDVLFAPHHGRDSGKIPNDLLKKLNPKLVVIGEAPSESLNYYIDYNTITQNSAGDITFECLEKKVHIYTSKDSYTVSFLTNEKKSNNFGYYLGTLKL